MAARQRRNSGQRVSEPVSESIRSRSALSKRAGIVAVWISVLAVVTAVHWPVLSAQAISFDDDQYLFLNPELMRPTWERVGIALKEVLKSSSIEGYYEPLTLISLMADVKAGGTSSNLYPFHRTSLCLHVACTLFIMLLVNQLFGRPWFAAAAGLLFGLHPLTVEPVAWVWERKTLLAAFFVLAAMILYVRYSRTGRWWPYAASLVLFVLALMAKPTVTPLPVLLLLLNVWPMRRLAWRGILKCPALLDTIPFFLIAAGSALITLLSTAKNASVTVPGQFAVTSLPLQTCYLVLFYLGKIFWPAHLSSAYVLPQPMALSNPVYLGALAGVAVICAAILLFGRRAPALPVGIFYFFFAILPTLGFVRYSWVTASDKYVYFPAIGILLIVIWALMRWCSVQQPAIDPGPSEPSLQPPRNKQSGDRLSPRAGAALLFVVTMAGAEAVRTRAYLDVWKDSATLCRHMLTYAPDVPQLHISMGTWLVKNNRSAEGMEEFRTAIHLDPNNSNAIYNLGRELLSQGQIAEAITCFQRALELKPHDYEIYNNLGIALAQTGQPDAAAAQFEEAIRIRPRYPKAHENLATLRMQQNRLDEAVEEYRLAIQYDLARALPHRNLALVLAKLNRKQEAIDEYRAALREEPNATFAYELGDLLAGQGRSEEAILAYQDALQIDPRHARARQRLEKLSRP